MMNAFGPWGAAEWDDTCAAYFAIDTPGVLWEGPVLFNVRNDFVPCTWGGYVFILDRGCGLCLYVPPVKDKDVCGETWAYKASLEKGVKKGKWMKLFSPGGVNWLRSYLVHHPHKCDNESLCDEILCVGVLPGADLEETEEG